MRGECCGAAVVAGDGLDLGNALRCKPPWPRSHHRSIFADMSVRAEEAILSDAAAASADVEEKSELLVDAAAALTLHEHYDTTGAAIVPGSPLFTCQ